MMQKVCFVDRWPAYVAGGDTSTERVHILLKWRHVESDYLLGVAAPGRRPVWWTRMATCGSPSFQARVTSTTWVPGRWSCIVFNMLVSNTDDHLRNHGFLPGRQAAE